jgi:hypothetical protein
VVGGSRCGSVRQLLHFGDEAIPALADAIKRVAPRHQADVVATLIDARFHVRAGAPPRYVPALESALWSDSIEARRLAMNEVSRYGAASSVLPVVDAIHEDPELLLPGIASLARLRQPQAGPFLEAVLRRGQGAERLAAARALGEIGDAGRTVLRDAARSEDAGLQRAAFAGLAQVAEVSDLALLRQYLALHPGAEDEVVRLVRDRAEQLERLERLNPTEIESGFTPGS